MCSGDLTLPEALGVGLLECFVRQEESRGSEPSHGSDLERALSLLFTQQRLEPPREEIPEPLVRSDGVWFSAWFRGEFCKRGKTVPRKTPGIGLPRQCRLDP
jgi:hypothetical protein